MGNRIFIGLVEIAGYYSNVAQGLRNLGYEVQFAGAGHVFQYGNVAQSEWAVNIFNYFLKHKSATPRKNIIRKVFWSILVEVWKLPLFIWSLFTCDIYILSFGTSFLYGNVDLCILKWLGKKVICNIGHGSDARPPYIDGSYMSMQGVHQPAITNYKRSIKKKKRLARIEKYADLVICSPFTGHFLTKPFINWYFIGVPGLPPMVSSSATRNNAISILHAPSNPHVKGTVRIREAIANLKKEGFNIEYNEIVGRPNKEVIEAIRHSDVIIDQLYSDTPLAGFATEAAWQRKAAAVGGYAWQELEDMLPKDDLAPNLIFHPDDFETFLKRLVQDASLAKRKADEVYQFVSHRWTMEAVADRYNLLLTNKHPHSWVYDPRNITYIQGVGLTEAKVKQNVREILKVVGERGLCMEHNPVLQQRFIDFANQNRC